MCSSHVTLTLILLDATDEEEFDLSVWEAMGWIIYGSVHYLKTYGSICRRVEWSRNLREIADVRLLVMLFLFVMLSLKIKFLSLVLKFYSSARIS